MKLFHLLLFFYFVLLKFAEGSFLYKYLFGPNPGRVLPAGHKNYIDTELSSEPTSSSYSSSNPRSKKYLSSKSVKSPKSSTSSISTANSSSRSTSKSSSRSTPKSSSRSVASIPELASLYAEDAIVSVAGSNPSRESRRLYVADRPPSMDSSNVVELKELLSPNITDFPVGMSDTAAVELLKISKYLKAILKYGGRYDLYISYAQVFQTNQLIQEFEDSVKLIKSLTDFLSFVLKFYRTCSPTGTELKKCRVAILKSKVFFKYQYEKVFEMSTAQIFAFARANRIENVIADLVSSQTNRLKSTIAIKAYNEGEIDLFDSSIKATTTPTHSFDYHYDCIKESREEFYATDATKKRIQRNRNKEFT